MQQAVCFAEYCPGSCVFGAHFPKISRICSYLALDVLASFSLTNQRTGYNKHSAAPVAAWLFGWRCGNGLADYLVISRRLRWFRSRMPRFRGVRTAGKKP